MDQTEKTTPLPDKQNTCLHWDHCDCDECVEECNLMFNDLEDIINATESD